MNEAFLCCPCRCTDLFPTTAYASSYYVTPIEATVQIIRGDFIGQGSAQDCATVGESIELTISSSTPIIANRELITGSTLGANARYCAGFGVRVTGRYRHRIAISGTQNNGVQEIDVEFSKNTDGCLTLFGSCDPPRCNEVGSSPLGLRWKRQIDVCNFVIGTVQLLSDYDCNPPIGFLDPGGGDSAVIGMGSGGFRHAATFGDPRDLDFRVDNMYEAAFPFLDSTARCFNLNAADPTDLGPSPWVLNTWAQGGAISPPTDNCWNVSNRSGIRSLVPSSVSLADPEIARAFRCGYYERESPGYFLFYASVSGGRFQ